MTRSFDRPPLASATSRRRFNNVPSTTRSGFMFFVFGLVGICIISFASWYVIRLFHDLNLQRYRDRVNFAINTGDEWAALRPTIARRRYLLALEDASKVGLDGKTATNRMRILPVAVAIPEESTAQLIRTRLAVPAIEVEVNVMNGQAPITNLTAADFQVFHDGRELRHFAVAQVTAPLVSKHFAILVDRSGSVAGERLAAIKLGFDRFVESARGEPRMKILSFADYPKAEGPWTNDSVLLKESIQQLTAGGGTALRNAIRFAVDELNKTAGERYLILFTDGKDTAGGLDLRTLVEMCRANRITVHCAGFATGDIDRPFVEALASRTGGTFSLATEPNELVTTIADISRKLSGPVYRLTILDPGQSLSDVTIKIGAKELLTLVVPLRPRAESAGLITPNATRVSQIMK